MPLKLPVTRSNFVSTLFVTAFVSFADFPIYQFLSAYSSQLDNSSSLPVLCFYADSCLLFPCTLRKQNRLGNVFVPSASSLLPFSRCRCCSASSQRDAMALGSSLFCTPMFFTPRFLRGFRYRIPCVGAFCLTRLSTRHSRCSPPARSPPRCLGCCGSAEARGGSRFLPPTVSVSA